jgi:hypothetical protein
MTKSPATVLASEQLASPLQAKTTVQPGLLISQSRELDDFEAFSLLP